MAVFGTSMSARIHPAVEEDCKWLGCSPIKVLRELGLDRGDAGLSLYCRIIRKSLKGNY